MTLTVMTKKDCIISLIHQEISKDFTLMVQLSFNRAAMMFSTISKFLIMLVFGYTLLLLKQDLEFGYIQVMLMVQFLSLELSLG